MESNAYFRKEAALVPNISQLRDCDTSWWLPCPGPGLPLASQAALPARCTAGCGEASSSNITITSVRTITIYRVFV